MNDSVKCAVLGDGAVGKTCFLIKQFFYIHLSSNSLNLKFAFSFFLNEILLVHSVSCPTPLGVFTYRKDNIGNNIPPQKKQTNKPRQIMIDNVHNKQHPSTHNNTQRPGTQQATGMACTARPWSTSMPPVLWWMARFPFENMNKANGNINQLI